MNEFSFNAYQEFARRTQSVELTRDEKERHAVFGIASEVGEIHSIYQHVYQGKAFDKNRVIDELGDVMWFASELCDALGVSLEDVARGNIEKLIKRYPDGFDPERSECRHEIEQTEHVERTLVYDGDLIQELYSACNARCRCYDCPLTYECSGFETRFMNLTVEQGMAMYEKLTGKPWDGDRNE